MPSALLLTFTLFLLTACGNPKAKETVEQLNGNGLTASGINVAAMTEGHVVVAKVYCTDRVSTNQTKIDELTKFKNSMGLTNAKTLNYYINGFKVPPATMGFILTSALDALRSSSTSDICPHFILTVVPVTGN